MKPNEFTRVEEGVLDSVKDAFAKKGWFGQDAEYAAYARELGQKQQAVASAVDKQKMEKWLKDLPVALAKAVEQNVFSLPESAYKNYNKFNALIETAMLAEAHTAESFMKQYMEKLARSMSLQLDSEMQDTLEKNIRNFIGLWRASYNPNVSPEQQKLNGPAQKAAQNLYGTLITAKSLAAQQPQSTAHGTPPAPAPSPAPGTPPAPAPGTPPAPAPSPAPGTPPAPAPSPAPGTPPAPSPAPQVDRLAQLKAEKAAKDAAERAERDKQVAATKQSNIQTSQADNELVAKVKAAKAKPGFQQTAQDRLAIQQGAAKGIHESKKPAKISIFKALMGIH